jgi:hypothetical protein
MKQGKHRQYNINTFVRQFYRNDYCKDLIFIPLFLRDNMSQKLLVLVWVCVIFKRGFCVLSGLVTHFIFDNTISFSDIIFKTLFSRLFVRSIRWAAFFVNLYDEFKWRTRQMAACQVTLRTKSRTEIFFCIFLQNLFGRYTHFSQFSKFLHDLLLFCPKILIPCFSNWFCLKISFLSENWMSECFDF